MSNGLTGAIVRVNLTTGSIEKQKLGEQFYRMYMGGGAFGTYFLLRETSADTDALAEQNVLTIAPGVTTGAPVSGASRCCVTALSPITGAVGDSQAGGSIGPMVKRAGCDAIVITGRAEKPVYLLIDGGNVRIVDAGHLRGLTVLDAYDALTSECGGSKLSILQCGPAGEKLVRFACLVADLNDVAGRTGMGAVFGSKNLRAVVVRGDGKLSFADPPGLRRLSRLAAERLGDSGFPATLSKYGTPGVVGFQAEAGNLATHNYSRSFHKDYKKLDGATFEPEIGAGHTTCFGCVVGCRRKVKVEGSYEVTNRLGGPEFETLGLLGSNLDITDPAAVAKANELCNNYGIDTITMGGLTAYLFECMGKGLIRPEATGGTSLDFGDPEALFWLIDHVAHREGIGDILAEGFEAAIDHFGPETAACAIHVKNNGLAVHMAQVKPSQALMYAVCPIGPDHMSSEHDWLLASNSEACKGLGIFRSAHPELAGEPSIRQATASCDLDKVRMTVYSQYFYSLLDTLCLCMFCWGPGNLFKYGELEELLSYTTGWECTLWELMKVGERRINMMRQLNARRGFSRRQDELPARLGEALPDGPAKGKRVDIEAFPRILDQYYALMGWDSQTGNPTGAKLLELGLQWTT
ncbi:MAG: aldehyde ferredoxin oxidoreductase family protein [Phycisphaerales bacterium]|nr:MAG: aldehyde ferredoxin oxidoreductase family protein [Phycisphaerales bacterium]